MNVEAAPVESAPLDHERETILKRSKRFIDRQQISFAIGVVFYAILFPTFFLALLTTLTRMQMSLTGTPEEVAFYETLQMTALEFTLAHIWWFVGALVYIGVLTLVFSHRIFGPIRVFENALHDRSRHPGEPVYCSLRKSDYFHGFARQLEETLNKPDSVEDPERSEDESD
jgi:hypothetical protein